MTTIHNDDELNFIINYIFSSCRFGSFEIFKPMDETTGRGGPSPNNKELLTKMLDYTLQHFYKDISAKDITKEEKYLQMYQKVTQLLITFNINVTSITGS